jgi:Uncharacterized conserved protein
MLGVKRYAVRLEPYNEQWAQLFEETKFEVQQILGSNVIDVQHIGSTAIKGIVAKPILDIAVVVQDLNTINLDDMKRCGYIYMGEKRAFPVVHILQNIAMGIYLHTTSTATSPTIKICWLILPSGITLLHIQNTQCSTAL